MKAKTAGSATEVLEKIRSKLQHLSFKLEPTAYLDTGLPSLNCVLGNATLGIPYGIMMEISGWEGVGKSANVLCLAALAQQDGALVIWIDLERSFTPHWAKIRGLDPEAANFVLLQPYVGVFGGKEREETEVKAEKARLSTAQELLSEAESIMAALRKQYKKMLVVIDSVPALLSEAEATVGLEDLNMKSDMALPVFMSRLTRRWVGLAATHNCIMCFINQLREGPAKKFQDPTKTPGGNALRFYSHVRVRVRRTKGSRIVQSGKTIGIRGVLKNTKNKVGGLEMSECGFKLFFNAPMSYIEIKALKKEAGETDE
jgi:recombination protein RecA